MLLVSLSWGKHIVPRIQERFRQLTPEQVLRVVAEINRYMPVDWRMTRSRNNFRISVVGPNRFDIVGSCHREGDDIINLIDNIFPPGFYDSIDLDTLKRSGMRVAVVNEELKRNHSDMMVPNMYFFQQDLNLKRVSSRLFARQYEKLFRDKNGYSDIQYHRIHPVYDDGLDLHNSVWVKWNTRGNVDIVHCPDPKFRGKSFWNIPALPDCRSNRETYLSLYTNLMKGDK